MKKILVFAPILPQWQDVQYISETLNFLKVNYELDFIDPLKDITNGIHHDKFFSQWNAKIEILMGKYDVFMGFSLGGLILQNSCEIIKKHKKKLVLFSTPSFADDLLTQKLNEIIGYIKNNDLKEAINCKNRFVFSPYGMPHVLENFTAPKHTALRMELGLQFVLENDSRSRISSTKLHHLHLIGEQSQLVNRYNIVAPPST